MPLLRRTRRKTLAERLQIATIRVRDNHDILLDADVVPEADGAAAAVPMYEYPSVCNYRSF